MPAPAAVVVGAGPNGLTAAIVMAAAGISVTVLERHAAPGGGARTAVLTRPGFLHDVCASNFPLGAASPVFRALRLEERGLQWAHAPVALAHPFDDGPPALLHRSLRRTADGLKADAGRWRDLLSPLAENWDALVADFLGPLALPRARRAQLHFSRHALRSGRHLAQHAWQTHAAPALLAGLAAHGAAPLHRRGTAAFGLVLAAAAHVAGMPFAAGGAGSLTDALVRLAIHLGVRIETGVQPAWSDLADWPVRVLDLGPHQAAQLAAPVLSSRTQRRLRAFRYGLGVCKADYALAEPAPWRDTECRRAGVLHLGGDWNQFAPGLAGTWKGHLSDRPFLIAHQSGPWDSTRAPDGRQTLGVYAHVPLHCELDIAESMELQIERFAPGFREVVLERHVTTAAAWPAYNPNLAGGDISGGLQTLRQTWRRPLDWRDPYRLPAPGLFLCSASTPPGGGVHGLCGYHAARSVLRRYAGLDFSLSDLARQTGAPPPAKAV